MHLTVNTSFNTYATINSYVKHVSMYESLINLTHVECILNSHYYKAIACEVMQHHSKLCVIWINNLIKIIHVKICINL